MFDIIELTEEHSSAKQPLHMNIDLKQHQLTELKQLILFENQHLQNTNFGCLGDIPGYGKTITFLALVNNKLFRPWKVWKTIRQTLDGRGFQIEHTKYSNLGDTIVYYPEQTYTYFKCTLLVIPYHLLSHWIYHIETYTNLDYELFDDDSKYYMMLEELDILIITDYDFSTAFHWFQSQKYAFYRLGIDEADTIELSYNKFTNIRFLWCITSTYRNIFHRNQYLDKQSHYYLNPTVFLCKKEFLSNSFDIPDYEEHTIECKQPAMYSILIEHCMSNPYSISNDIVHDIYSDNIQKLYDTFGIEPNSSTTIIEQIHVNYDKNIKKQNKTIDLLQNKIQNIHEPDKLKEVHKNIEDTKRKIDVLYKKKERLNEQMKELNNQKCLICFDTLEETIILPCCLNVYCMKCIIPWIMEHKSCPMCRTCMEPNNMYYINNNKDKIKEFQEYKTKKLMKPNTKYDKVLEIIQNYHQDQFVLFSNNDNIFKTLQQRFEDKFIRYGILEKENIGCIDNFKQRKIQVLCLNAIRFGAGLDLHNANHIIFMHTVNKDLRMQCIGRCQRPNRKTTLHVWNLLYPIEMI